MKKIFVSNFRLSPEWILPSLTLLFSFCFLFFQLKRVGLTWDECYYVDAARKYLEWLKSPDITPKGIYDTWSQSHEHPPLVKVSFSIFQHLLGNLLGLFYASRLATVCFFSLLLILIYRLNRRYMDPWAAGFGMASALFLYRLVGDALVAATDLVMSATYLLAVLWFLKAMDNTKNHWQYSLAMGVALLTKNLAFFLLFANVVWAQVLWNGGRLRKFFFSAVLPIVVFVAGWPWLWSGMFFKLIEYAQIQMAHGVPGTLYLGIIRDEFTRTPWHYSLVMLALTTPAAVLLLSALGLIKGVRNKESLFLLSAFLIPITIASLPGVPKYNGLRLFLPSVPFLAVFLAMGFSWIRERLARIRYATAVFVFAWFGYHAVPLWKFHSHYLSYFNEIVGGVRGAANMGMELTYWGDAINSDVIAFLNENLPEGATLSPLLSDACYYPPYQKQALLREDIRQSASADYSLHFAQFHDYHQGGKSFLADPRTLGGASYRIIKQFEFQGVPLVVLLRRTSTSTPQNQAWVH